LIDWYNPLLIEGKKVMKMFKMEEAKRFTLILPEQVINQINEISKEKCVSSSSWVRGLILKELEQAV